MRLKHNKENERWASLEMKDPIWTLYKEEGMKLDEILKTKPQLKEGKCLVWTKDKGWEEK